jgi:hypothetical protein
MLLRLLIAELRVNGKTDIQPAYCIVTPGGLRNLRKVETVRVEPRNVPAVTSLQAVRREQSHPVSQSLLVVVASL